MRIGISSYALHWHQRSAERPYSVADVMHRVRDEGVGLVQLCDMPALDAMSPSEADGLAALARRLDLTVELGTRGLRPERIRHFVDLARRFDARVLRSMVRAPGESTTPAEARGMLAESVPVLDDAGVTIALETYEQVRTADLVALVDDVGSERVGVCLDPSNTIAILEHPRDVVAMTDGRVANLHVKDFAFARSDDGIGFRLAGAPLGEGLLDYDEMVVTVGASSPHVSQVIEHWLPLQSDEDSTLAAEDEWLRTAVRFLHERVATAPESIDPSRTDEEQDGTP